MDDIKLAARKAADEAWWANPKVSKRFIAAALLEAKAEGYEDAAEVVHHHSQELGEHFYQLASKSRLAAAEVRRGE